MTEFAIKGCLEMLPEALTQFYHRKSKKSLVKVVPANLANLNYHEFRGKKEQSPFI